MRASLSPSTPLASSLVRSRAHAAGNEDRSTPFRAGIPGQIVQR